MARASSRRQQQPEPESAPTEHILGAELVQDFLADLTDHNVDQGSLDRAQARVIELAVTGDSDRSAAIKALAQETGMQLEVAEQFIEHGAGIYQEAADRIMGGLGLEGDDLQAAYSYMRNRPGRCARSFRPSRRRMIHGH